MNILKKSALGVSASLLFITLFVFGLAFGLHRTFGTPDTLKGALKDSGIYQSAVGDVLDQAQKEQPAAEGQDQIPVNRPEVQSIIKNALSPEILQTQTERALDSIYAWVQGKTPKLEFAIELGDVKKNLADGLGQYVEQQAASLPACAPGTVPGGDFDPFNATCLPQGVNPSQVAAEAKNQVQGGEFFKETTITADSLKGSNGKTIEQQLAAVPAAYQKMVWAVYGAGLLALLLSVAVVFLSASWRSGLKKVSVIFIVVGSISAFVSWLSSYGVSRASEFAKEPLQQSGVKVAQALANDLRSWWMWYGIALLLTGLVVLLVLHFTKPKAAAVAEKLAGPAAEPTPAGTGSEPKPAAAQKPKPVKKLVQ